MSQITKDELTTVRQLTKRIGRDAHALIALAGRGNTLDLSADGQTFRTISLDGAGRKRIHTMPVAALWEAVCFGLVRCVLAGESFVVVDATRLGEFLRLHLWFDRSGRRRVAPLTPEARAILGAA